MDRKPGDGPAPFRSGFVAIVGAPNAGKSTLLNTLLGEKISIVTEKPQTTRRAVRGILSAAEYQIVFLDTPGILTPAYLLHEHMMREAGAAVADADLILHVVDAPQAIGSGGRAEDAALGSVRDAAKPALLVLNKVDRAEKQLLLPLMAAYAVAYPYREILPVSALRKEGIQGLPAMIAQLLPEHPPYYPSDIVSDQEERFFVAEIIREKIFRKTVRELPYAATVQIVQFAERREGKWFISAEVYVERDSQKAIVIGKNGAMLREIGRLARSDIETFLGHPVYLELHVRVRKWRDDPPWLGRLGYGSAR
ncbi:MAG: GTPase Era [Bacteroidota bacterium]